MNNQHKLTLLDNAAELIIRINSLERQADMIQNNIKSNPLFDGLVPKWEKSLQFTKTRIKLVQYAYNILIKELYISEHESKIESALNVLSDYENVILSTSTVNDDFLNHKITVRIQFKINEHDL